MNKRLPISAVLVTLVCLIVAAIRYLGTSTPELVPKQTAALPAPAEPHAGTQGSIVAVNEPPRIATGRFAPEATSMEDFSSNPKRDPSEQLVIDIAKKRELSDEAKVKQLLDLIPKLPPDAQTLAMENATALIPDTDYLKHQSQLLKLATTPEMREAVMDDSLTRGEELRLPNLLELMRTSNSDEEKLEIREIFEAYLDKDYGPNPAHWEAPLRQWVAENSDS